MRNYFEEMNIDYNELKRYEDIETYYDEVEDYTKLIKELQCDRVEALKQIVNKNREIERLKEMKLHTEKYASEMEDKYILEKNKNNKAIEFLDNECLYDEDLGYCDDLWCGRVQELVNILKGVDKE